MGLMFSLDCAESQASAIVSCGWAVAFEGRGKYGTFAALDN